MFCLTFNAGQLLLELKQISCVNTRGSSEHLIRIVLFVRSHMQHQEIPHILQLIFKSITVKAGLLHSHGEFGELNALARVENNKTAASELEILQQKRFQRQKENKETAVENKQLNPPICSSQLSRFISIDSAAPFCLVHARSSIAVESCLRSIMLMSSSAERRASSETLCLWPHMSKLQMCPRQTEDDPTNQFRATARPRCTCRAVGDAGDQNSNCSSSSWFKCVCVYLRPL